MLSYILGENSVTGSDLEQAFEDEDVNKAGSVKLIGDYLPNFSHIEIGKSLDSKM